MQDLLYSLIDYQYKTFNFPYETSSNTDAIQSTAFAADAVTNILSFRLACSDSITNFCPEITFSEPPTGTGASLTISAKCTLANLTPEPALSKVNGADADSDSAIVNLYGAEVVTDCT